MLLLPVSGVAPVNWGILGDWMGEERATTYRCLLALHLMTSIIFFLLLGWHGLCWTYRLSRTKRLKGERIPELHELSSLHGRTEDHSIPSSGDHPEGKDGPQCCLSIHPGTGLLNTTSCCWSAVGASYWRMPGAFSLHASSPRRVFEGLVERALGAAWYLALGLCQASAVGLSHQPHQGHRCQRPEQVFVVAQSQLELSFVSGADGKPWRTWTERW